MQEKDIQQDSADFTINADENAAGTTHLNNPLEEESTTEQLENELKEQKDKYLRLFAEFDNFRRRTAKENIEIRQTAGKEIIVALLDILDDCDRAEKQMDKEADIEQVKQGSKLIFNKLKKLLQSKGLKAFNTLHTDFDTETQEAITEVPVIDSKLKGKVIDEVQKGYNLNDKLVRFAKVVVGK